MSAPPQTVVGSTPDQVLPTAPDVVPSQGEGETSTTTARPERSTSTPTSPAGHPDLAMESEDATSTRGVGSDRASTSHPRVIGLDLSLTSTGVAGADWAQTLETWSLPRKGATRAQRWARMRAAREQILPFIDSADLVVQESPAYSTGDMPGSQDQAWLWWAIYGRCAAREIPWVEVGTSTLKVYATSDGRASKEDVVQAVATRRPGLTFRGSDQADALTLAAMGLDHIGHPPVVLPKAHRRALDSINWPTVVGAS